MRSSVLPIIYVTNENDNKIDVSFLTKLKRMR